MGLPLLKLMLFESNYSCAYCIQQISFFSWREPAYDEFVEGLCGNLSDSNQNTNTSSEKSSDYSADG